MHRRTFIVTSAGCAAHLLRMSDPWSHSSRLGFATSARGRVVAREVWGRIEEIGPGLWAVISTPLAGDRASGAWRTVCNGGIIAGRNEVMVVEAFATAEGAAWLADEALRLTGRPPGVGVVTHFHGDHCGGLAGYRSDDGAMAIHSTSATRELLGEREVLPAPTLPATGGTHTFDLGGRTVRVVSRAGHTASDVSVEVDDPRLIWCGDLVWNGMFPNYVHATPSRKAASVRALLAQDASLYIPGHGDLARRAEMTRYLALLDHVERHARRAVERGDDLAAAAAAYSLPAELGEWVRFSPRYFRVAFDAWARELRVPTDQRK